MEQRTGLFEAQALQPSHPMNKTKTKQTKAEESEDQNQQQQEKGVEQNGYWENVAEDAASGYRTEEDKDELLNADQMPGDHERGDKPDS